MKKTILALVLLSSVSVFAENTKLDQVTITGKDGGRLDGRSWSSEELINKVHVVFYVDPDEKDMNEHVGQALKNEHFPRETYQSWAIINMAATWLPNFALESALKKKQETYPDTFYVKDFTKTLVKKWGLQDDSSNILVFNKQGELVYQVKGKASEEQLNEVLRQVKNNL